LFRSAKDTITAFSDHVISGEQDSEQCVSAAQRSARQPRREFTEIGFNSSRVT